MHHNAVNEDIESWPIQVDPIIIAIENANE